jgi:cellulose synthase/poly-beta-1,6-N-acetylglucosamine synthase-like glycosyltransferase
MKMAAGENITYLILFIVFCLSGLIELFYYLWFYLAVYLYQPSENSVDKVPVSVIICARNEAENLRKFLPSVLEQDYPSFEVIVVNDCSEDNSDDVLGTFLLKYPNLRISPISKDPKFTHNKKFAQFIGIKAAANEILLLTDADCQPESDKWMEKMTSNFTSPVDFVLGYGGYLHEKGLLNRYIRYDSMFIGMQYLGMAIKGIPYMGVGRNLAYKRSVFFRNKGFGAHNRVISGDDDLFVNANASKANTRVEFRPGSHTRSIPAASLKEWIKQKQRHLTTAGFYRIRDKILLTLEPVSRIIFYTLFIILLSSLFLWPALVAFFVLRLIIQLMVIARTQKKLNESKLILFSAIFDIFSPFINSAIYLSTFYNRTGRITWK